MFRMLVALETQFPPEREGRKDEKRSNELVGEALQERAEKSIAAAIRHASTRRIAREI